MFFPSFGTILVLVAAFVYKKNNKKCKKYKKDTFPYIFNHCLFDLSVFFIYMFIHVYLFVSSNFEKIEVLSMRFSKEWSHFGVYSRL